MLNVTFSYSLLLAAKIGMRYKIVCGLEKRRDPDENKWDRQCGSST